MSSQFTTSDSIETIKLVYKNPTPFKERVRPSSSNQVFELFRKSWDDDNIGLFESLKIMLLDQSASFLGIATISVGSTGGTKFDPKKIFQTALITNSSSIIICHNHTSGDLQPSAEDIELTHQLIEAGKLLELHILDHIIIGPSTTDYTSLHEENLI